MTPNQFLLDHDDGSTIFHNIPTRIGVLDPNAPGLQVALVQGGWIP